MSKRVPVSIQKPDRDFETFFTIPIAIKNCCGKIADRFSFGNRILVFPVKPIRDFHVKTGLRLKNPGCDRHGNLCFTITGMLMSR